MWEIVGKLPPNADGTQASDHGQNSTQPSSGPDLTSLLKAAQQKAANASAINQQNRQQVIERAAQTKATELAQGKACLRTQSVCNSRYQNVGNPALNNAWVDLCGAQGDDCLAIAYGNEEKHELAQQLIRQRQAALQAVIPKIQAQARAQQNKQNEQNVINAINGMASAILNARQRTIAQPPSGPIYTNHPDTSDNLPSPPSAGAQQNCSRPVVCAIH
jgi:hypothetical protein